MFRTLENMHFEGKRVLVRIDMDVPLENEVITDDFRLKKALPTLKYLEEKGAKQIIIIGHIGRPKGEVIEELRVTPVANKLSELLGEEVVKIDQVIGASIPENHKFIVLENLRFYKGEKDNDDEFSKKLARLADIYVLEAFAVSHRDHASITGVQKYLPSCAGFQLEKEVHELDITHAEKPIVCLFGAAKVRDKIQLVEKLLEKVDKFLVGGAVVFTFFKSKGIEVGKSLVDDESLDVARKLLENPKIVLPDDIVVGNEISSTANIKTVAHHEIPHGMIGLDIGEKAVEKYKEILKDAKTVIWNGPMGLFETKPFDKATHDMAEYITTLDCHSIVGGGDTAAAIRQMGFEEGFTHVSTGGGASLQLLEGEELPGIKALEENMKKFD